MRVGPFYMQSVSKVNAFARNFAGASFIVYHRDYSSWVDFFEIRRYFSKIASNSADTAVNFLRTTDVPFS